MGRRRARRYVLEALYWFESVKDEKIENILEELFERENETDEETKAYAMRLAKATVEHLPEIDDVLRKTVKNWDLERIARIDRNILRFAICEMMYFDEIPPKVSIDEAIDIAKIYSTEQSGKFVNGILDRVLKEFLTS